MRRWQPYHKVQHLQELELRQCLQQLGQVAELVARQVEGLQELEPGEAALERAKLVVLKAEVFSFKQNISGSQRASAG